MRNTLLTILIGTVTVLEAGIPPVPATGRGGMVVSAHPLATSAGVDILKSGGNAFDAAIAVGFALQSVYPSAGNIGGGGFAVIRTADGKLLSLDFRETAPTRSTETMFLKDSTVIPDLSTVGALSAGVPGTVRGLEELHKTLGSLSWQNLLDPAINLSAGYTLTQPEVSILNRNKRYFLQFPETAEIYTRPDSLPWKAGDSFQQPDLHETLSRIAQKGADDFYTGETSRLLIESMTRHNGLISTSDLSGYKPVWRKPLILKDKNRTFITMGLPSSGGMIVAQTFHALSNFDIDSLDFSRASFIHHVLSAWQLAYADRASWLGDPEFVRVPFDTLISESYFRRRFHNFNPDHHTPSEEIQAGTVSGFEPGETTHFAVADSMGNCIAVTYTLNGGYGSGLVVKGAGFLLNNEMDDFSIQPGIPNLYGLIGAKANAIQPGKRMLSSMTPAIVLQDNSPWLILGGPGGSRIPTEVIQTYLNMVYFRMNPAEAVSNPRFHYQWLPDVLLAEKGALSGDTFDRLQSMGYKIQVMPVFNYGRSEIIQIEENHFSGFSDPRGYGTAKAVRE